MAFLLSLCLSSSRMMFGTVENSEHTKDIYLFIKDVNRYHFERSNKMSLLILHLKDLYNIYNSNYLKQLNVCTVLHSNVV